MIESFSVNEHPHRRYNPLVGEWLLVSPQRNNRPWQGRREITQWPESAAHDPNCYLCPGNVRANGELNPIYKTTFTFTNDFSALLPDTPQVSQGAEIMPAPETTQIPESPIKFDSLFQMQAEQGRCRVICFSPDHSKTLSLLNTMEISALIKTWMRESEELGKSYPSVQIFENKGALMGCSNPHPHGQIWAQTQLPTLVQKEDRQQREYIQQHNSSLLQDYMNKESAAAERIVLENEDWLVVVPFWAAWPFETLLLPKMKHARITEINEKEQLNLGNILRDITARYDNLFKCSFPYSMGWHGAPFGMADASHWQLHAHFYPPLLRGASIQKFMVGYEMLAEPQRDLSPEQAAERLRQQSSIHFRLL